MLLLLASVRCPDYYFKGSILDLFSTGTIIPGQSRRYCPYMSSQFVRLVLPLDTLLFSTLRAVPVDIIFGNVYLRANLESSSIPSVRAGDLMSCIIYASSL